MPAPAVVKELAERFEVHRKTYQSGQYNEAQVRREFLDPLFEALGWDVFNRKGYADAYKEVIHEDAIKIGGRTKAPDYCFRAGGQRTFFVEAKRPSVDIADAISPAYQLRRYAWSAKLPVSILTDFDEFAVYDCRIRPVKTDKAATARVIFYTYKDYLDRWDELVGLFSPDAIRRGAIERFLGAKKVKKGTAQVDDAFLGEIEAWRDVLARHIALRNPGIAQRDLNFAVGKTIDRLVFLRICEDRGIEPYGRLQDLVNAPDIYRRLAELFQRADERYNSGLFHFNVERERPEAPDELTLGLAIDDKPLKDIIRDLYYPDSPYEFSVLPAEILGQVYEQFLGKVIRLTRGGQAKVEEKPEVRKAGGVYYTPAYIVEYIVQHTVGKLLEGKTPQQAAKLRILDPACGSGSFLIGAYQHLLDWHRDRYVEEDAEKHARARALRLYRGRAGDWRLTSGEKRRILLTNIYGVDIDPQAVEVTKLSLLLKVLEGETQETIANQLRLFHQRALPDLGGNIKCGNSLIGPDFCNGHQMSLLEEEEQYRINVFDWKAEFAAVFRGGGFDGVIGNPPYIRVSNVPEIQRPYLYARYDLNHRFDIYVAFVLCGFELLSPQGHLGFILPNKFFTAEYGVGLRRFLSGREAIDRIVDFGDTQVFDGPTTYTCLLFVTHEAKQSFEYLSAVAGDDFEKLPATPGALIKTANLSESPWTLVGDARKALLDRLRRFPRLGDFCDIAHGLQTGCDGVFLLTATDEPAKGKKDLVQVRSGAETRAFAIQRGAVRRVVKGSVDVRRYYLEGSNRFVLFPYIHADSGPELIDEGRFSRDFPRAWAYLARHAAVLRARKGKNWYAYRRRNYDLREGVPRLLVPSIGQRACFACDLQGDLHYIGSGGGGGGGYGLSLKKNVKVSILYLLGLLNSRLLDWHVKLRTSRFGRGYYAYNRQYIEPLPICALDLSDEPAGVQHYRMVGLVELMLRLQGRMSAANTHHEKTVIQRQIDAADRQIDALVYEIYGLSAEEVRIVEEATAPAAGTTEAEDGTAPPRRPA